MSGEAENTRRLSVLCIALMATSRWLPAGATDLDGKPADPHPLVAIGDVLADVNAARRQVRIRGVVTWRGENGLIVQDRSGGIWIDIPHDAVRSIPLECDSATLARLAPGLEIEVEGWTNRGGYSPNIFPEAIRILGEKPVPEPRAADRERFFSGADDCLRVTATGLVQGVRDTGTEWLLTVVDRRDQFTVEVPKGICPEAPRHLVDATVRLVGVAVSRFNTRGEYRASRLLIVHAADVVVVRPPTSSPFESPEVPLHAIAQYSPDLDDGHRIRTRGIVTYAEPGRLLYLQAGMMGVRVETVSPEPCSPGDEVEVAGFVDCRSEVAGLVEAVVRRLETGRPLQPIRIAPDQILTVNGRAAYDGAVATPGDFKGCLVAFPARVLDVQTAETGGAVLLLSGSTGVVAWAEPATFAAVRLLEPGSEVMATGIVMEDRAVADSRPRRPEGSPRRQLQLLLRSAADMRLMRSPSWWKPQRLVAALLAAAAIASVAIGWVVLLRRQVARQLAVIETKLQAEAATEERHRIAREFHDTLEQDLAGITLQLDAAAHRTADGGSRAVLEEQRGQLARLQAETHDFLWDLRDPARHDGSLFESLAAQVAYLQSLADVPIRLAAAGELPRVPPLVQHHLLRLMREAVSNAVRHAEATAIDVGLTVVDEGLRLVVEDDGVGFHVAAREAVEGHFGIRGMRERARRIGADLVIESTVGGGARVVLMVPASRLVVGPVGESSKTTMVMAGAVGHDRGEPSPVEPS